MRWGKAYHAQGTRAVRPVHEVQVKAGTLLSRTCQFGGIVPHRQLPHCRGITARQHKGHGQHGALESPQRHYIMGRARSLHLTPWRGPACCEMGWRSASRTTACYAALTPQHAGCTAPQCLTPLSPRPPLPSPCVSTGMASALSSEKRQMQAATLGPTPAPAAMGLDYSHVHQPCSPVMFTSRVHQPCSPAVFTSRVHQPYSNISSTTGSCHMTCRAPHPWLSSTGHAATVHAAIAGCALATCTDRRVPLAFAERHPKNKKIANKRARKAWASHYSPGSSHSAWCASSYGACRRVCSHAAPPPGFACRAATEPVMNLARYLGAGIAGRRAGISLAWGSVCSRGIRGEEAGTLGPAPVGRQ